ncbi:zinc-ribbon domain-containing protein [Candidatus Thorarchaeota archaeon]|nr:MAG: zinc-ribbon domain-containing protein [Candidatus Thorarchaeota archaeon]
MVRQIVLDFLHKTNRSKTTPDREDVELAMAFILAESHRKGKAKLKFLSPVTVPFWIVQMSDTSSIVLSGIGESAVKLEMSEDTATGPVKRILSSETRRFEDIPEAVEKATPLLKKVEPTVHQVRNIQDSSLFAALGTYYREVDPNEKLNALDMKIDSNAALSMSEEFRYLLEDAKTRYDTMGELHKIAKERLTDQLNIMDNVTDAEMGRWEKRLKQQEESSNERIERLKERFSERVYRLKDTHEKNLRAIVAEFVRDTVEVERFFTKIADDVKLARQQMHGMSVQDAVSKYRSLVDELGVLVPTYVDVTDSLDDLASALELKASDLEEKLAQDIRQEEDSVQGQIQDLHNKIDELKAEIKQKEDESTKLREKVVVAIESMDEILENRMKDLREELEEVQRMTLSNDAIKNLAPLTLLHVRAWIATYTTGKPKLFVPMITPEDRFGLPLSPRPLDEKFGSFIEKLYKRALKDSASFKTSLNDICGQANILQDAESMALFKKGMDRLRDRQLLGEGVRDKVEPKYSSLVGRCPECNAEIPPNAKFCNECGKSLV